MRPADTAPADPGRLLGLDVLRAAAITGVLFAHADLVFWGSRFGWAAIAGSWGVELFFVLSGFLIGGLLIDIVERGATARGWGVFLIRRWVRTLPLYFIWLLVLLTLPEAPGAGTVSAYALLSQNLAWPMVSGWFPVSWSLMVEEWFYLLFGTFLLALAAWRPRVAVPLACVVFMVVPCLARMWADEPGVLAWDDSLRKVVALRLDAIAYGVLMVWFWRKSGAVLRRWAAPALALGVLLLASSLGAPADVSDSVLWRSLSFSMVSVGFALCFPAALRVPDWGGLLSKSIGWLSRRSYGIYIIHLTLMEMGRRAIVDGHVDARMGLVLTALAIAGLAEISYRTIELPLLARRPRQFPKAEDAAGWSPLPGAASQ